MRIIEVFKAESEDEKRKAVTNILIKHEEDVSKNAKIYNQLLHAKAE